MNLSLNNIVSPMRHMKHVACVSFYWLTGLKCNTFHIGVFCPPSLTYQECGNLCYSTCRDISMPNSCESSCIAGCNCPNGTVENDWGICVPINECPCYYQGNSYPPGHFMMKKNVKNGR